VNILSVKLSTKNPLEYTRVVLSPAENWLDGLDHLVKEWVLITKTGETVAYAEDLGVSTRHATV
jgi:hypothetical protein